MIEDLIHKLQYEWQTLEITPTKSPTIEPLLDQIKALSSFDKLDGFTVTDNPLAKLKYSSTLAAVKCAKELEKPIICTISMRDKNKLALQSELLGLNDFGVQAVLALTGDPAKLSDQPNVKGVFEGNSVELLRMIKFFNAGVDFSGKPIKPAPKQIFGFGVSDSFSKDISRLQKKWHAKIENGAVGIITQPIFDANLGVTLLKAFNEVTATFADERKNAKLIFGIFPITSLKTAQFLYSHVPGIYVPESYIDALLKDDRSEVGIDITKNVLDELWKINPRVHYMTANRFWAVDQLIKN
ncbi:MAG: 5,10-methylenetetrahydrofolate reductase [Pseudomonadota bacterium]|jgi:5,10-methylenetetrahydrofolate reductase